MQYMHIHNAILFSSKKEENPSICNKMDQASGHHSKLHSHTKKDKYWYHIDVESNKKLNSEKQRVECELPRFKQWGNSGDTGQSMQILL